MEYTKLYMHTKNEASRYLLIVLLKKKITNCTQDLRRESIKKAIHMLMLGWNEKTGDDVIFIYLSTSYTPHLIVESHPLALIHSNNSNISFLHLSLAPASSRLFAWTIPVPLLILPSSMELPCCQPQCSHMTVLRT